jgi:myo-inositol-1(or 4)-monophosphatase
MNHSDQRRALRFAVTAAQAAGELMRRNFRTAKKINQVSHHDIKLELDVRCQKQIEKILITEFPRVAVLGEEGVRGDQHADYRWVVDPIDGTVNFAYGIPHACVSIALQARVPSSGFRVSSSDHRPPSAECSYQTLLGVVYDPFCDELWTALHGQPARLNGKIIHVSQRRKLKEAIIALGFAKYTRTVEKTVPIFNALIYRVRKIRIMGAAALGLAYVASGRLEAYAEYGIRLWDIAAGGLILECAGGDFWREAIEGEHTYHVIGNNGLVRRQLFKPSQNTKLQTPNTR